MCSEQRAWKQMEEMLAEPYKHLARSQGGLWSHQGTVLEPPSISEKWNGANSHPKWNSLWHWFILRAWRKSGHCWDSADQNRGHFWLPHKQEKENLLHRQSSLPKISLALATSLISPSSWIYEKEKENYNKSKCFLFLSIWPEISNQRSTKSLLEPTQASNLW